MRVATSFVSVVLFTYAATATRMKKQYAQEGNYSEARTCIETFMDLEESLVTDRSNIDRLHNAFFPSNQRVPVAVDLVVHFSTSLHTHNHKLCSPSTARLDNHTSDHKFRWFASTMLLFVQPEMLRPLSLFVYQGIVTTAEVVIDPVCEKVDNEVQQMARENCTREKPEHLLNKLCIHLKSYDRHKVAEVNRALTGYCLYYFNHTDPHILDNSTEDTLQQVLLFTVITFLWLIIAISVPAALYSIIQIVTTQFSSFSLQKESIGLIKISVYSIIAAFTIAPFLDISIIGLNVWLLMNCKFAWFILCFDAVFIALSIFEVIYISALALYYKTELDTWVARILYTAGIFSLVMSLQLLAFHGTFILLVFIFSPIPTACFTLIYISALFSILMAVSIVIEVIHKCYKGEIYGEKCYYAFQITVAILFTFCLLPLDALLFITLARARLDYFAVGSFFGALVPTAIVSLIFFVGNILIGNNKDSS